MTPTPAYEVGRNRPPVESRFQPGRSGNPRGRPRKPKRDYRGTYGASWLDDVVLDEVYRHVPIEADGRIVYLTTLQAAVRAIGAAAAQGSRLHARLLFELTDRIETRRAAQRTAILKDALDAKAGWAELCALAEQHEQPRPEPPFPHPDTLHIDPRTGMVATDDPLWKSTPSVPSHAEPQSDCVGLAPPSRSPATAGVQRQGYDWAPAFAGEHPALPDRAPAEPQAEPAEARADTPAERDPQNPETPLSEPEEASPPHPAPSAPDPANSDAPLVRTLPPGIAFTTLRTVLAHNRRWYRATTQRLANFEPEPPPPPPPPQSQSQSLPKWAKNWSESARKEWHALMNETPKMR
jgi:hypothetical protein